MSLDLDRIPRWTPGPQARVNRSHPLAQGLVFCDWFPEGEPMERQATKRGSRGVSAWGAGAGGSAGAATYGSAVRWGANQMSMVVVGQWDLSSGQIFQAISTSGSNDGEVIFYVSAGNVRVFVDGGLATLDLVLASVAAHTNLPLLLGVNIDGVNVRGFVNTFMTASGTLAAGWAPLTATSVVGAGCRSDGTNPTTGVTHLAAVWTRTLSDQGMASCYNDPFAMFREEG